MGQKTENIFERARVNIEENDHENALRLLNEVLNREPSHRKALQNKGLIKVMNASEEEAEQFLKSAIEQQPDDDRLYQMLGTFYHNHDTPKKALTQFKKSIELNDRNSLALKGLGRLFAHYYNDHEKAISYFNQALNASEENRAEAYFNRGCSHMILQHMDKAEQDLRQATSLNHAKAKKMVEKYFES